MSVQDTIRDLLQPCDTICRTLIIPLEVLICTSGNCSIVCDGASHRNLYIEFLEVCKRYCAGERDDEVQQYAAGERTVSHCEMLDCSGDVRVDF